MIARRWLGVLAVVLILCLRPCSPEAAQAAPYGWTFLSVDGQEARIYRDAYGAPHVFAPSNRALFYAYGYAVAQDRLWQLDLYRRTARGTLAEVLGASTLASDLNQRMHGYTEVELESMYAVLPDEAQEILTAYQDGINAYRDAALADPGHRLPWEFHQLSYSPDAWRVTDSLAVGRFLAHRFSETGGRELQNQALLQSLIAAHGTLTGTAMFEDLRWSNDPDAPVSVPPTSTLGQESAGQLNVPLLLLPDVERVAAQVAQGEAEATRVWARYGIPTKLGSYAWAVGPSRSTSGNALLFGGPQMDFSAPDMVHEIQLTGGQGFDVIGVGFAGIPAVLIGHNRSIAWSMTSGMGDNADLYVETLDPLNAGRYWHDGAWQAMITRTETITVLGRTEPVTQVVPRTVHGPVIALDAINDLAYSLRRAHWMEEHTMLSTILQLARAGDLDGFQRSLDGFRVTNHFLYADTAGNIAYWQAGAIPVRPDGGHAGRFPWPGDGNHEWTGEFRAVPHVINPAQGYLVNWNNKASVGFDNGDAVRLGKQDRVTDIDLLLAADPSISWDDMATIPTLIGAFKLMGNETRYVRTHLLAAIASEAPDDTLLQEIAARLSAWDGRLLSDVVAGTEIRPEEQIWNVWLSKTLLATFGDELGSSWSDADLNTLLHALEGTASGVPPAVDYFDDVTTGPIETADQVLVQAMRDTLDALTTQFGTSDIDEWTTARPPISFVHPLGPVLGQIPLANRPTYAQMVELGTPVVAANVLPLGQSGFISAMGEADAHFGDQLALFDQFLLKPMRLVAISRCYVPIILRGF